MSNDLVSKHCQDTISHTEQTKRLELLRKEGGWEIDMRLSGSVSELGQNCPVMAI